MLEGTAAAAVDLVSSYLKGDARGSQAANMDVNLFNLRYIDIDRSVKSFHDDDVPQLVDMNYQAQWEREHSRSRHLYILI